jgi:2-methylcitrate dehydratase PrpD
MGPFDLYDGERPGAPLALGEPFALLDPGLELKPYPSCRFTHRAIDAVLAIRQRRPNGLPRRIVCAVDPFALKILIHPRPVDGLQAKFSLPYCAAVAWIDGWPKVGSFEDSRARRGDVQELLARVEVREASGEEDEVTILFESGEEDRERVRLARGNPARPLDREEHLRKVRNLCDPVLGPDGTRAVVDGVDRLEDLPKIGELCAALATGGSR